MSEWIDFQTRLPTRGDADDAGDVLAKLNTGEERRCLWSWIPPTHTQAKELWRCNGFTHWQALGTTSAAKDDA